MPSPCCVPRRRTPGCWAPRSSYLATARPRRRRSRGSSSRSWTRWAAGTVPAAGPPGAGCGCRGFLPGVWGVRSRSTAGVGSCPGVVLVPSLGHHRSSLRPPSATSPARPFLPPRRPPAPSPALSLPLHTPAGEPTSAVVCPQLGVKALTYNDLIQAQKEISAHNQQLREQTEQLQKDNGELRTQSLRLVGARRGRRGRGAGRTGSRHPSPGPVCHNPQSARAASGLPLPACPHPQCPPFLGSRSPLEPAGPTALPKAHTLSLDEALQVLRL